MVVGPPAGGNGAAGLFHPVVIPSVLQRGRLCGAVLLAVVTLVAVSCILADAPRQVLAQVSTRACALHTTHICTQQGSLSLCSEQAGAGVEGRLSADKNIYNRPTLVGCCERWRLAQAVSRGWHTRIPN
jgi:hypothetical protein